MVLISIDFSRLLLSKEASNSTYQKIGKVVFLPVIRFLG
jgi:hypothetical protein